MAKVSMKMTPEEIQKSKKAEKSKVKKSGFLIHREGLVLFKRLIDELKSEGMDESRGFDELYAIYAGCVDAYNEMVEDEPSERFYKNKVKKNDHWGPQIEAIYNAYTNCTKAEKDALTEALDDFVTWGSVEGFLSDWFDLAGDILDGVDDYDVEKAKKFLKSKGYTVSKADETEEEESIVEDDEVATNDESDDSTDDAEETKEEKSKKSKTRNVTKRESCKTSPADILKSKGWVRKEKDNGPDAEDMEESAGVESEVKVPETPEPTENVEQADSKVPEIDALIEEGGDNKAMGEKEGDDMDALEEEGGDNKALPEDMDDIDALIEKARQRNGYYNGTPAPTVGSTQPYANNYRTVQMGEGKISAMAQFDNPKVTVTKNMTGSRKRV